MVAFCAKPPIVAKTMEVKEALMFNLLDSLPIRPTLDLAHIEGNKKAHLCFDFGLRKCKQNWQSYKRFFTKMTQICCCTYRSNHLSQETENWQADSLNIETQTFCILIEIKKIVTV